MYGRKYLKSKLYSGACLVKQLYVKAIGLLFPPCKEKLVQFFDLEQSETYDLNGATYVPDLLGDSGLEDGRTTVGGGVLLGDRYIQQDEFIPTQTAIIEFNLKFNVTAATQRFGSRTSNLVDNVEFGTNLYGRLIFKWGSIEYDSVNADTEWHEYRIENGELYQDGNKLYGVAGSPVGNPIYPFDINALNNGGVRGSFVCDAYMTDINLNGYEANFDTANNNANDIIYFTNRETNDFFEGRIQSGTGSDVERDLSIYSGADGEFGYTLSDGVTYYDATGNPIPQGTKIANLSNGLTCAYLDAGQVTQASAQYTGRLKADLEYAQGSFTFDGSSNSLNTGITPNNETKMKLWGQYETLLTADTGHGVIGNGERFYQLVGTANFYWQLGWGGVYNDSVVADTNRHQSEIANGLMFIDDSIVVTSPDTITGITGNIILGAVDINGTVGAYCNYTMYKAEITHSGSVHVWGFDADTEAVIYTIDGVVQTPPTIQGTVTSAQWGNGAVRQATDLYEVIQADETLTDRWYDTTDPENPVRQLKAIEDIQPNEDDQLFTTFDDNGNLIKQGFYDEALVSPCLEEAEDFFKQLNHF